MRSLTLRLEQISLNFLRVWNRTVSRDSLKCSNRQQQQRTAHRSHKLKVNGSCKMYARMCLYWFEMKATTLLTRSQCIHVNAARIQTCSAIMHVIGLAMKSSVSGGNCANVYDSFRWYWASHSIKINERKVEIMQIAVEHWKLLFILIAKRFDHAASLYFILISWIWFWNFGNVLLFSVLFMIHFMVLIYACLR